MNTCVLLHFEYKMTSQSLSNFCMELRAAGRKFDNDCDVIFVLKMW